MLAVGNRYKARVDECSLTQSSQETPGVWLRFNCGEHGTIEHTAYLTGGSMSIAEKSLEALGVDPKELKTREFWADVKAGKRLPGAECEIVIGEDEYNGQKRIIVKFINATKRVAKDGTEDYLAKLFGGGSGGGGSYRSSSAPPDFPDPDAPRPRY